MSYLEEPDRHVVQKLRLETIMPCGHETFCQQERLDEMKDYIEMKNIEMDKIKEEKETYRKAWLTTFEQLRVALEPTSQISRMWSEIVSNLESVSRAYGGLADDGVYDIWTFLKANSLEDKIELAKTESKILRAFSMFDIEFSIFMDDEEIEFKIPEYLNEVYSKAQ